MSGSRLSFIALIVLALVVTACGDTPPPSEGVSQEPAASLDVEPAESEARGTPPDMGMTYT
jgi:hypothetical protein